MNPHQQKRQAWIASLVKRYRDSGLTRVEFSKREGISVSTLDYYRRQQSRRGHEEPSQAQRLLRVSVNETDPSRESGCLALVLHNGRRIQCSANFDEQSLARLIRVAEAVQ